MEAYLLNIIQKRKTHQTSISVHQQKTLQKRKTYRLVSQSTNGSIIQKKNFQTNISVHQRKIV